MFENRPCAMRIRKKQRKKSHANDKYLIESFIDLVLPVKISDQNTHY